jgi:hypothetical protein
MTGALQILPKKDWLGGIIARGFLKVKKYRHWKNQVGAAGRGFACPCFQLQQSYLVSNGKIILLLDLIKKRILATAWYSVLIILLHSDFELVKAVCHCDWTAAGS